MADTPQDVTAAPAAPVEPQEPTTPDSSPEETKAPVEAKDPILEALTEDDPKDKSPKSETDKPKEEPTEEDKTPEVVEKPKADETKEKEPQEQDKPLAPKSENRFQKLANENRQLKQTIEELNAKVYQPQTVQELMEEGESEAMAEAKALRQEVEYERFNRQVTELNNSIESESARVLQEFPIFNPDSEDYKPEIAERATQLYQQAAGFQTDPNTGLLINANVLPYNFYKTFAETYQASTTEGQLRGQTATEEQLSRVDSPGSVTPPKPKEDPVLAILKSDDD